MKPLPRKPTIHDIADKVGVSTTTVINVLKGRTTEVSPSTALKIQKTVKALGYVKNLTAASLSTRQSHVIALVMPGAFHSDPTVRSLEINPFYGDFVLRLENEARARGYSISLYAGGEEGAVSFLLQRQYDAAILLGLASSSLPQEISRHHVHQILIDSFVKGGSYTCVCGDETHGGSLAAQHLIDRGRKKLAFVGDVYPDWPTQIPTIRYKAALAVCRKARVPLTIVKTSTSFKAGVQATDAVMAGDFDGVVTAADVIAAGLVQGLCHARVDVPGDVAVVGYDNLLVARMCLPTLTTIDQRLDDKIRAALDLVQHPAPGKHVKIKPELVIRESS